MQAWAGTASDRLPLPESVTRNGSVDGYTDDVRPIHYFVAPSPMPEDPVPEFVTSIVIANPFHDPHGGEAAQHLSAGLNWLRHGEQLICSLRDHHPHGDGRQYIYRLAGFEHAHSSDVTVCRPIVDWYPDETAPVR